MAALAASLACAVAPAASASAPSLDLPVRLSGRVAISWHGDPARDCAHAGTCGFRGAMTVRPEFDGDVTVAREEGRWVSQGGGGGSSGAPAVVRVRREPAEPGAGLCVDTVEFDPRLDLFPTTRGGAVLSFAPYPASLSSGRCAGPTAEDLAGLLPTPRIDVDALRWRPATLHVKGRRPFGAGSLAGEVAYDLRIHLGRLSASSRTRVIAGAAARLAASAPPTVTILYRVARLSARTTAHFRGLAELGCDLVDGCGVVGLATYRFDATSLRALVVAVVPGDVPPTRAAVLDAIRAGRAHVVGDVVPSGNLRGTATVEELRPSGTEGCRDSAPGPAFSIFWVGRGRSLRLRPPEAQDPFAPDPLRARCPGPSRIDVLGSRPPAAGRVRPAELLRPRLTLRMAGGGHFASRGYAGRHDTTIEAELVRERLVVRGVRG